MTSPDLEFWGLEVKPGEHVKYDPGNGGYVHMSQVALGDFKKNKGNENVAVFVKASGQKLVIGTLSAEKCSQISYDIVFDKEFELSHASKNASVYFLGYKTSPPNNSGILDNNAEDIQLVQRANGKPEIKEEQSKPSTGKTAAGKPDASATNLKVKAEANTCKTAGKVNDDDDDDDEDSDDADNDDGESDDVSDGDEDMAESGDESDDDDEDESSDEQNEGTPEAETSKKRSGGSASKTPAPEKKARLISPIGNQKTGGDGKKAHTATPHPAKRFGKMPSNDETSKQQTPKSLVSCMTCNRNFNSEAALEAHRKAKH